VGFGDGGRPDWGGIVYEWADEGFVSCEEGFFGLAPGFAGQGLQDV